MVPYICGGGGGGGQHVVVVVVVVLNVIGVLVCWFGGWC
jgi:hypothetical protein